MPFVAEIKEAVAQRFRLAPAELYGRGQRRELSRPRQIAMTLACELTRHTPTRIGHFFDRDRTTVIHARRAVAKFVERDLEARATLEELRERFAPELVEELANGTE